MLTAFLPLFCPLRQGLPERGLLVKGFNQWRLLSCATPEAIASSWPQAARKDNFWVSQATMSFLVEQPQGIETTALVLENQVTKQRILLPAQTFYFRAADQVSEGVKGETSSFDLRRFLLRPLSFKILCLGQFLTSGPYCQDGLEALSPGETANLLTAVAETLMCREAGYTAVLLKDLYHTPSDTTTALEQRGFHQLPADPSMHLKIEEHWRTAADYLADLTSKYRVRARRARTKLTGITRRLLTQEEVIHYQDRCYQLYQQVSSGADFNAASLSEAYFPWLASLHRSTTNLKVLLTTNGGDEETFPESSQATVRFHGYFDASGKLVGFTTAIPNDKTYHAHFLGLEETCNQQHHLYHNMLFDLLEDAIAGGFKTLDYGRTALEIKSSLGAEPVDYAVQIKARHKWLNRLIPLFTPAVYSAPAWTARNPFRESCGK